MAILRATAVLRGNTDNIAQCGMSRATLEATGHRHQETTCSVLPRWPPGQQANKQQLTNTPFLLAIFDGHEGALVQYRAHCLIEMVQGFTRSHWTPPSGKFYVQ
jgi:hypothetical protein